MAYDYERNVKARSSADQIDLRDASGSDVWSNGR